MAKRAPPNLTPTADSKAANAVVLRVEATPVLVLQDETVRADFLAAMEREVDSFVPDLTTATGRKAIASLAFRVSQTRALIDKARLTLTAEQREAIKKANAEGAIIDERLAAIRDRARQPLTEWEAAEAERVEFVQTTMRALQAGAVVTADATAADVEQRLAALRALILKPETFGDMMQAAENLQAIADAALTAALARIQQEEADRAELEALRQERAAREAQAARDAEAKAEADRLAAEAEREAAAVEAARVAEEARQAAEAERARLAQEAAAKAAEEAAEAARQEATRKAQAEADAKAEEARQAELDRRAAIQAAHEAELEAERQRVRDLEAAAAEAEAERQRVAADAKRAADEAAAAEAARQRDTAHRKAVIAKARQAMKDVWGELPGDGASDDDDVIDAIVAAIVAGLIPGVAISF
jgi:colicin import membrane protein